LIHVLIHPPDDVSLSIMMPKRINEEKGTSLEVVIQDGVETLSTNLFGTSTRLRWLDQRIWSISGFNTSFVKKIQRWFWPALRRSAQRSERLRFPNWSPVTSVANDGSEPSYRISAMWLMFATAVKAKPFNNYLGFGTAGLAAATNEGLEVGMPQRAFAAHPTHSPVAN
jgi:hypothetical protein